MKYYTVYVFQKHPANKGPIKTGPPDLQFNCKARNTRDARHRAKELFKTLEIYDPAHGKLHTYFV